jgi:hypothetical protein
MTAHSAAAREVGGAIRRGAQANRLLIFISPRVLASWGCSGPDALVKSCQRTVEAKHNLRRLPRCGEALEATKQPISVGPATIIVSASVEAFVGWLVRRRCLCCADGSFFIDAVFPHRNFRFCLGKRQTAPRLYRILATPDVLRHQLSLRCRQSN